MQTVSLGRSDLRVTPICLGTMTFGEQVGTEDAHRILSHALDRGVNFIDTAEMYAVPARRETYGATENIIGQWFAKHPGLRQRVVLATKAKGSGPFVEFLKKSPTDLTTMARRNGGVFPIARAYEVIEGAGVGHGTRDMPIWGQDYSIKAAEYYMDVPYNPEVYVRSRILALAEYLHRLQAK